MHIDEYASLSQICRSDCSRSHRHSAEETLPCLVRDPLADVYCDTHNITEHLQLETTYAKDLMDAIPKNPRHP